MSPAPHRFTHSLAEELARAAQEAPGKPFVRMAGGEWTYGEVAHAAAAVAAGLRRLGVRQGCNASLLLPNCIEFVVTWFALARLGAVTAPVNTAFRGRLLRDALALVESDVIVVHHTLWPQFEEIRAELPGLRNVVVVGDAPAGTHAWSDLRPASPTRNRRSRCTSRNRACCCIRPAPPAAPRRCGFRTGSCSGRRRA